MRAHTSHGLERLVRYALILLRVFSVQYWLIALFPDRRRRDIAVDVSVLAQCLGAWLLWWLAPSSWLCPASAATAYLLVCLYLSLINIIFFSAVPSVNEPTTSSTRTLLLLALNVLQVTFTFALFYRTALQLSPRQALFGSFLVLGTLGVPDGAASTYTGFVPLQLLSDLLLLTSAVSVFVPQVPLRISDGSTGRTSGTAS